jgi:RNA polymerase sigma-70 factor (ECF subfamily)
MAEPVTPSDESLAARCQQGDMAAFEILFERYQRPILAYLYQMTRDYADASCIAQDAFLKLFEKVDSFDITRRFSPWFYAVARNAAIDHIKAKRRGGMVNFSALDREDGDNVILSTRAARADEVDLHLNRAEARSALREAIDELPLIYREIIELVVFQEKSYEEASQILGGVSLGTLRSRMFHALRHLRERLEGLAGNSGQNLL